MTLSIRVLSILAFLLSISFANSIAMARDWNGNWNTNYGQLRLLQNGDRLYGDYAERGTLEGKISPDGRTARAYFIRRNGRWGTVQWRIANDKIAGTWAWSSDGLPKAKGGNSWTGTRSSARTSQLKYASQSRPSFPRSNAIKRPPFSQWFNFEGERPSPAPTPNAQLSRWYGTYDLVNIDPHFEIAANIIHYRGKNTAAVDLQIYAKPGGDCPQTMHTRFCRQLWNRSGSSGSVKAEVTGVRMLNLGNQNETVRVGFRLPGDKRDRLLVIRQEATYYAAAIYQARVGPVYDGYAKYQKHECQRSQCSQQVFDDLRNNPARYRGKLDSSAIARMINMPNGIDQSHGNKQPAPQPQPQPSPQPRNSISDSWAILDETSENLGEISISLKNGKLAANGKLRGFFETGSDHETAFQLATTTDQAVAFDVTVYAGQSGESKQGTLMVELPSQAANNPRGTLIIGEDVFLIELVRPTNGLDPSEAGDTPAIGIYSVNYQLRDVPTNRTMRLRKQPDRSSSVVGSLPSRARDLQILKCDREINSLRFMEADRRERLSMLSSAWCQITDNRIAGWLPGRYLVPQQ